jgi:hypothetical protein
LRRSSSCRPHFFGRCCSFFFLLLLLSLQLTILFHC